MEVILELPPVTRKLVENVVSKSREVFSGYFIPCAPAGIPMMDCLATGVYVLSRLSPESRVYASLRVRDYSLNHVVERAVTAYEYGLAGLLLTRGDPPSYGGDCRDFSTEYVLGILRKLSVRMPLGLVLSLRYPLGSIVSRVLNSKPDFAVILRYSRSSLETIKELAKEVSSTSTRLHVFLLLGIDRNVPLFEKLRQPYIRVEEFGEVLGELKGLVDAVVVSSPNELYKAIDIVSRVA